MQSERTAAASRTPWLAPDWPHRGAGFPSSRHRPRQQAAQIPCIRLTLAEIVPECSTDYLEIGGWVMVAACVKEYLLNLARLENLISS